MTLVLASTPSPPSMLIWSRAKKRPCLVWYMIAEGVLGMFGMFFTIASNEMVIKWSMTAAIANGILTDPVTVKADRTVVQGVSACNIQQGLEDKMTSPPLHSGPGIHLRTDTLADTLVLSTSRSNDAGSEAASLKGTSCTRYCQHALVARLLNSSEFLLVCDRFGTSHGFVLGATRTTASTSGRPTSQTKSICSERRMRVQRGGFF